MPQNPFLTIDDLMSEGESLEREVKKLLLDGEALEHRAASFMFQGIGLASDLENLAAGFDFAADDEDGPPPRDHREAATAYVRETEFLTLVLDLSDTGIAPKPLRDAASVVARSRHLLPPPAHPGACEERILLASRSIDDAHFAALHVLTRLQRVLCFRRGDIGGLVRQFEQNGDRDAWIYQQALAGKSNSEIRYELDKHHPHWDLISTNQGVSQALRTCLQIA